MERDTSGFGLAFQKKEGCAIHPDDPMMDTSGWSDDKFLSQLREYSLGTGDYNAWCSRPELLKKLKEETGD